LIARILSPADGVFSEESAEQSPPQRPNTGTRRLLAKVPAGESAVTVAVLLQPVWSEELRGETPAVTPLETW